MELVFVGFQNKHQFVSFSTATVRDAIDAMLFFEAQDVGIMVLSLLFSVLLMFMSLTSLLFCLRFWCHCFCRRCLCLCSISLWL